MCEFDETAVFASAAGDELWSEIVEDQISNYSDQNLIVNYGHSIFQESAPLFLHLLSPQHSELVIHTRTSSPHAQCNMLQQLLPSGSSFSAHIGEESAQGRSQYSEQVTGFIFHMAPSEQVIGLFSHMASQGPSEQVTGLISHMSSQGPSMQQNQQDQQQQQQQQQR